MDPIHIYDLEEDFIEEKDQISVAEAPMEDNVNIFASNEAKVVRGPTPGMVFLNINSLFDSNHE